MSTVRHWRRAGYKCDHTANSIEGGLIEALRCARLSTDGAPLMKVLLEDRGEAKYLVPGSTTHVFRTVGKR